MWNKTQLLSALQTENKPLLANEIAAFAAAPRTAFAAEQHALLVERGEKYLHEEIPPLPFSVFELYWKTGDRQDFQVLYFERRGRLLVFSLLAWMHPENAAYRDALTEIIWAICAEPFWSLPAHFMDTAENTIPFAAFATQLDLFACETGFALAETLELTRALLPEMAVQQAEIQIERRIFAPFLDGERIFRFEGMSNNWSGVCASAIGGAALHLIKDNARLASILHRCLCTEQVYLDSFGADGVCTEGVDYWTYGFGFFTCFADLLSKRTNGALDYFANEKVQAIARSQQAFYFSGKATLSFSDGGEHSRYRLGLSAFLQSHITDIALPCMDLAAPVLFDTCYRHCLGIRDFLWSSEANTDTAQTTATWLPDAQWFLSRHGALALAAKAGHNGESHNHNDCGSFILYKNGAPLLCDLGAGLYDAAYFGPNRYEILVNRSGSHNVPLVNGSEQKFGAQFATQNVSTIFDAAQSEFSCALQNCYDEPDLISLHRHIVHRYDAQQIVLTDTAVFREIGTIAERFCACEPIVLSGNTAIFTRDGEQITLTFDPALVHAEINSETFMGHHALQQTAWFLTLTPFAPSKEITLSLILA